MAHPPGTLIRLPTASRHQPATEPHSIKVASHRSPGPHLESEAHLPRGLVGHQVRTWLHRVLCMQKSPGPFHISRVQLFATPGIIKSMEFFRPGYWSGLPFSFPGDLPNPGIEPRSPALQADSLPAEPRGSPRILEWVAYPFSSGSSRPRNRTRVSCIAGGFFTN